MPLQSCKFARMNHSGRQCPKKPLVSPCRRVRLYLSAVLQNGYKGPCRPSQGTLYAPLSRLAFFNEGKRLAACVQRGNGEGTQKTPVRFFNIRCNGSQLTGGRGRNEGKKKGKVEERLTGFPITANKVHIYACLQPLPLPTFAPLSLPLPPSVRPCVPLPPSVYVVFCPYATTGGISHILTPPVTRHDPEVVHSPTLISLLSLFHLPGVLFHLLIICSLFVSTNFDYSPSICKFGYEACISRISQIQIYTPFHPGYYPFSSLRV